MAANTSPIFPNVINSGVATIAPADTQTLKPVFTAGANGSRLDALNLTSSDTSARDIQIWRTKSGGSAVLQGTVSVLATGGTVSTVVAKNVLADANMGGAVVSDERGNKVMELAAGEVVSISAPVTITTAKLVSAQAQGGDY